MKVGRRFRQFLTLKDRLALFATEVRKTADHLPPGRERDELLKKARQADTAAHLDNWTKSPSSRPPK